MDSHMDNGRSSLFFAHKSATKRKEKEKKKMNKVKDENLPT